MRILWHSSAPFGPSSYSVQSFRTVPGIVRDGHEVVFSTFFGLQGSPIPWHIHDDNGQPLTAVRILPSYDLGDYGASLLRLAYNRSKADVLMSCCDVWVFRPDQTEGTRFCPWFPVDHDPAPPLMIEALKTAVYPISESQWGQRVLADAGIKAAYVPCSFPADVFRPYDRRESRAELGIEDCDYLVLQVAANKDPQDRKGFNEAMVGFAKFAQSHPGARLMIHTNWGGPVHLKEMAEKLGIEDLVIQPDQYAYLMGMLGTDYMAKLYSAADVLINPAHSEGFGFPIVEAQLCGTPAIASDYSSTAEVLAVGWKIPVVENWTVGAESFRARCTPQGVADALEEAYQHRRDSTLRDKARQGVLHYDSKRVHAEYWRPTLAAIQSMLDRERSLFAALHPEPVYDDA